MSSTKYILKNCEITETATKPPREALALFVFLGEIGIIAPTRRFSSTP